MSELALVEKIALPILRGHNDLEDSEVRGPLVDDWPGLTIVTWGSDIDFRTFPVVNIRRVGGPRHANRPTKLGLPVIEMTAYTNVGLPETEQLYEDCLEVLYKAKKRQTLTPSGYFHSIKENMGATQFSSLFADSWRIQGLIKLGIRPPRT